MNKLECMMHDAELCMLFIPNDPDDMPWCEVCGSAEGHTHTLAEVTPLIHHNYRGWENSNEPELHHWR